jgi:glutamate synthase domain-containing protein 3
MQDVGFLTVPVFNHAFKGFASNGAGASAHGGLLVIDGDAGLRCGISLKGGDIVVGGSVGSFSAFVAQAGRMVICGDAGDALGDSLYEAVLYVRGSMKSLGADAQYEEMTDTDVSAVRDLLKAAGVNHERSPWKSNRFTSPGCSKKSQQVMTAAQRLYPHRSAARPVRHSWPVREAQSPPF